MRGRVPGAGSTAEAPGRRSASQVPKWPGKPGDQYGTRRLSP